MNIANLSLFIERPEFIAISVITLSLAPLTYWFFRLYHYVELFQERGYRQIKRMEQTLKNQQLDDNLRNAMQERLSSKNFRENFGLNLTKKERETLLDFYNRNDIWWGDVKLANQFLDLKTDGLKVKPFSIWNKIERTVNKIFAWFLLSFSILLFSLSITMILYTQDIKWLIFLVSALVFMFTGAFIAKESWKYKSIQKIKGICDKESSNNSPQRTGYASR